MAQFTVFGRFGCVAIIILWLYTPITYIVNIWQLCHQPFANGLQGASRDEIINLIGLVPPACWVTVWM